MTIRPATYKDIPQIMETLDHARTIMRANGNTAQWINGYPSEELMKSEVAAGHCFVCVNHADEVLATFCFILGIDHTYLRIYDGAWLNDEPYGVIHRMGTNGKERGVAAACMDWCFKQCANIRVDTHKDNTVMQHVLANFGFQPCGIIFTDDGTERIAYQRIGVFQ